MNIVSSILATVMLVGIALGQAGSDDGFAIFLLPKKDNLKNSRGDSSTYSLDEIKVKGEPFIDQDDIRYYNRDSRQLFTYPRGESKLITMNYELITNGRKFGISGGGRPFVVTVGKVPIYTGAFWLSISNQQFYGITIIPTGNDKWQIDFGYPSEKFFVHTEFRDAVNDTRILKSLEKRGQLYEDLEIIAKCKEVRPSMKRRASFYITLEVSSVIVGRFAEKEIQMELWDSPDAFGEVAKNQNYTIKPGAEKHFRVKFEKQVTRIGPPILMFREAVMIDRDETSGF
ncbi:MAG: hypothetical protein ACKVQW_01745 [Pyrinomonadaceae bacterium]